MLCEPMVKMKLDSLLCYNLVNCTHFIRFVLSERAIIESLRHFTQFPLELQSRRRMGKKDDGKSELINY